MIEAKRAQIGKFLTGFVSFLLIVLFVGIFIFLSSVLAKTRHAETVSESQRYFFSTSNNLLLEELDLNIEGKDENIMVADAWIYHELDKGRNIVQDLQQFFRSRVQKNKECILFSAGGGDTYFRGYYKYEEDKVRAFEEIVYKANTLVQDPGQSGAKLYRFYRGKEVLQKIELEFAQGGKKKSVLVESYLGPCLEEAENVK
ncbi:MAG: hypothetical protein Q8Q31_01350 [Nanoarchaeota archaeon]|nr:hypothetical protein [Nanoarchaeota archaeon]